MGPTDVASQSRTLGPPRPVIWGGGPGGEGWGEEAAALPPSSPPVTSYLPDLDRPPRVTRPAHNSPRQSRAVEG